MEKKKSMVRVLGENLILMDSEKAERYAQAIREGMWQCSVTEEPWIEGVETVFGDKGSGPGASHFCTKECLDSRADDEVEVIPEEDL